jgi:hypothetical protein
MEGTLHLEAGRHTLRYERMLAHRPTQIWHALIHNAELGAHAPILRWVLPDGSVEEATITVYDSRKCLECFCGGDILCWELQPAGAMTRLTFTHSFADATKAARVAMDWEACLDSLERRLP